MTAATEPVMSADRLDALARWMDAAGLAGAGSPATVEKISGGASNEILRIDRGGTSVVLRRPPAALSAQRSATMLREARVLQALAGTDVPHARLLGTCTDPEVLGSFFYVMDLVDGWSPMSAGRAGRRRSRLTRRCAPASAASLSAASACWPWSTGARPAWTGSAARRTFTSGRSTAGSASSTRSRSAISRASTRRQPGCAPTAPGPGRRA